LLDTHRLLGDLENACKDYKTACSLGDEKKCNNYISYCSDFIENETHTEPKMIRQIDDKYLEEPEDIDPKPEEPKINDKTPEEPEHIGPKIVIESKKDIIRR
jgi:hypothetical protein